ncbi:MAG: exodeoxyribonuclease VII small subunit [Phycisphaerae bacterium]|jgi:exodeoxyribonuclease VII small subunit
MTEKANKQELTFEQAIGKLKDVVSSIENGQVGLEESLKKYEEGMKLIAHCKEILKRCEEKIITLTESE